ncbi:hypothetical protein DL546_000842 [Coniochaeta pulveracea]|uniref:N-acetyltransferase domain-containing protein n=1 Tax=Coniochaeta pulveracea TaxID=177199 RepID=A0A420XZM4_9PEZI|nr:hypothetical protein DL546_000842 [Coniochaeta pulveracea]
MSHDFTYHCFRISKDQESLAEAARSYRQLRLKALRTSPESFSSTYESEAALTEADWIARLAEPGKQMFACVAIPVGATNLMSEDAGGQPLANERMQGEWVGHVVIRGPISRSDFMLPEATGQPLPASDEDEERWQTLGLFVLPQHQGRGLASRLCEAAISYLRARWEPPSPSTTASSILLRLMVKPNNTAAVRLYKKLGLEIHADGKQPSNDILQKLEA